MNNEVVKLLAERFLKKEDISDWAIKCLERGFDSKSLRMLAATNDSDAPSQTDEYFNRALKELGWDKIRISDYLMQYAKILAKEIVEDKTDPINISRDIYQILVDLDYPAELHAWFDFYEMISDYEEFLKTGRKYYFYRSREELISEIKKASKELIKEKV